MWPKPQIEYCMFDLDGLLIDSESICTKVTNEILAPYGKVLTWDIKKEVMGKPERETSETLVSFFPDISLTIDEWTERRQAAQDLAWPTVQLMPGAHRLISHLVAHKVPIAVATGSKRQSFELKTGHLQDTFGLFGNAVVCADDEEVKRGKPAPDVFLVAAKRLGILDAGLNEEDVGEEQRKARAQGLIFEDSTSGIIAGKRAGMNVVWVPDPNLAALTIPGDLGADETLKSLVDFDPESWGLPPYPKD